MENHIPSFIWGMATNTTTGTGPRLPSDPGVRECNMDLTRWLEAFTGGLADGLVGSRAEL